MLKTNKKSVKAQTKDVRGELTSPVPYRVKDDLPKIVSSSAMIYPVTLCEKPANTNYLKGSVDCRWETIHMKDLKILRKP